MLSNLASYIFGANTETVTEGQQNHEVGTAADKATASSLSRSQQEEDWEIVGGDVQPSLNLGSLDEVAPRPSTGSTGSSETPSEVSFKISYFSKGKFYNLYILKDGEVEDMVIVDNSPSPPLGPREIALTRSARRLTSPLSCPNGVSLPQMKALRSSQKAKQKNAVKQLTSKATDRHNKAVKIRSNQPKKAANMAIKASGLNKQLKQC